MANLTVLTENQTETQVQWQDLIDHLELVLRRLKPSDSVKLVAKSSLSGQTLPWVELVVVGDSAITKLNQQFFNLTEPTDVLSFPADADTPVSSQEGFLGSIVISVETASRQAKAAGLSLTQELKTLTGHGLLHLLGYHHR